MISRLAVSALQHGSIGYIIPAFNKSVLRPYLIIKGSNDVQILNQLPFQPNCTGLVNWRPKVCEPSQ